MSSFDLLLTLLVGDTVERALVGEDSSITAAVIIIIIIVTLLFLDRTLHVGTLLSDRVSVLTRGAPVVVVADGRELPGRMRAHHLDHEDILEAARHRGLPGMDAVRYAVLESDGSITIIPRIQPPPPGNPP